jgi:metal-responsive CopG/Arc/MetJ family transcriptional regulator
MVQMAEEKDLRVITPIPRALLAKVDDYRFSERLPSRAEAIRRLLDLGLKAAGESKPPARQ